MARIDGVSHNRAGVLTRFAYRFSAKRFGKVAEPLTVAAHHAQIFRA